MNNWKQAPDLLDWAGLVLIEFAPVPDFPVI